MTPRTHSLSVVIPVYNSQDSLAPLIARLEGVLPDISSAYEVVLVNDGSRDQSWATICAEVEKHPFVKGVNLMRNYGQHNAILCGIRQAHNEVIITMDDDLQHLPEEIHKLLKSWMKATMWFMAHRQAFPTRYGGIYSPGLPDRALAYAMGVRTIRDIGPFRAFRADLRDAFANYQNPSVIIDVLLSWGTSKFASVTVNEDTRQIGQSNYNFFKLFGVALEILTGFSTIPLRLASLMGFIFTLLGLAVFVYVVVVFLTAGSVPGFPFLASIIALFSGAQLFALGIFGEYLARIFDRNMDRPPYVIHEIESR